MRIRWVAVLLALSGCATLAPGPDAPYVLHPVYRPEPYSNTYMPLRREETQARDLERFLREQPARDQALSLATLLLTGIASGWPGLFDPPPVGSDTGVSWQLDPVIPAAHLLTTQLRRRVEAVDYVLASTIPTEATSDTRRVNGMRRLVADLHVHASRSHDSATPVRDILLAAQRQHLDVLAITDHDIVSWPLVRATYQAMRRSGELTRPLILVPGVEISTADGHLLAYFVTTPIPPGMPVRATVDYIHRQGGIAVLAHPNRPDAGVSGALGRRLPVNGVERFNGAEIFPTAWRADVDEADEYAVAQYGNSDAHFAQWVGAVITELQVTEATVAGVRDAMLAGRTRPRVASRAMRGFQIAMDAPGVRQILRGVNWPRRIWALMRTELAARLRVDDVYVRTSWRDIFLDAYRLNRLLSLPDRVNSPFDALHAPPVPVEAGFRIRGLRLFVELPLGAYRGRPERQLAALYAADKIDGRYLLLKDRPEDNMFFVWPGQVIARAEWQWLF
ncbi:MAG: hypothetical protein D6761_09600 [Candidatus Dadabacteria bacterium]|nr:MAG: hypothetical protein D6761_09600 [Candidatus Dadabacteria bacterium]